ncbi:hypothetical protein BDV09DRAFT_104781 [Aspergillus tetrazonus]
MLDCLDCHITLIAMNCFLVSCLAAYFLCIRSIKWPIPHRLVSVLTSMHQPPSALPRCPA